MALTARRAFFALPHHLVVVSLVDVHSHLVLVLAPDLEVGDAFPMAEGQAELAPESRKGVDDVVAVEAALARHIYSPDVVARVGEPQDCDEGGLFVVEIRINIVDGFLDGDMPPHNVVELLLLLVLPGDCEVDSQLALVDPFQVAGLLLPPLISGEPHQHLFVLPRLVAPDRNA
jgi:hypothetical protein